MSSKVILSVKDLSAGYGNKKVLENINFEINSNEIVGLLGANGCGKTTLIKSLCRIIPHMGEVKIEETEVSSLSVREFAKNCSLVPQKSGIGIDISVLDVVLMGFNPFLQLLAKPTNEMNYKSLKILEELGIKDRAYDNFQELSEGQKQLVIIARSIVADTRIMFMDEPESSLDFQVRYDAMDMLHRRIIDSNKCALISLHDINLALKFCDRLLLIKDRNITSVIDVKNDSISSIEQKLKSIYGDIKVLSVTKNNEESFVMVKD